MWVATGALDPESIVGDDAALEALASVGVAMSLFVSSVGEESDPVTDSDSVGALEPIVVVTNEAVGVESSLLIESSVASEVLWATCIIMS